ncbi:GTP binding protein, putative [Plasmodium gallinaceum]|uniref:GTP binding protein, putative n=1 Tax=Plasmodium gallinaceum TaxID=5849 RepID=A0A1J1GUQ5_PLAGA|nr:GTP binding protein, putative [Plasmodium gallinaceum]CRG96186.1 GTP binding protein, putative [Plasmodium gallinaceum]
MKFSFFSVRDIFKIRKSYFYNETKVKLYNSKKKKEIIVIHPVLKGAKKYKNSFDETILDAQEALGLARSANFKIANGISMPSGGWNIKYIDKYNKKETIHSFKTNNSEIRCSIKNNENEESYLNKHMTKNFRGENENYEVKNSSSVSCSINLDCKTKEMMEQGNDIKEDTKKELCKNSSNNCNNNNYKYLDYEEIEKKIAESIIIKANKIDNKFYFGKGKLNELSKYYLKNPTPYIFINTLLSPEQFRNLDFMFNSLLRSFHDELKLNNKRQNELSENSIRLTDIIQNNSTIQENLYENEMYFDLYNSYLEKEEEEEEEEREEDEMDDEYEDENLYEQDDEEHYGYNKQIDHNYKRKKGNSIPLYVELFDRYSIILYIFKSRAKSNLSKLQLEFARANFIFNTYSEDSRSRMKYIKYIENNVLGKSSSDYEEKYNKLNTFEIREKKKKKNSDYLGYTSNYIKSNETYKEYEKRIINNLYSKLKKELIKCKNNTNLQSNSRKHKALIAIVGYTNVGKTKLINYLTKSNLKAKNLLFQTLDNSYKNLNISECYSTIFIDSIGFIQNIPYSLYESFKLSLEAIKTADIIIHVIDVTHPYKEKHKKCVIDTLSNIGISNEFIKNNVVEVWNKIDKLTDEQILNLYKNKPKSVLPISAKSGTNCDILIKIIQNIVNKIKDVNILTLNFPTKEARNRINYLMKNFKVIPNSISYSDDGNTTFIKLVENPQNLKKYHEKFEY